MKDLHLQGYTISCKRWKFRIRAILPLLAQTYWAKARTAAVTRRSLRHSAPFGVFAPDGRLVGFLRLISDHGTMYYLADVIIDEAERGKGLGLALVRYALSHPTLCRGKGLLLTRTANGLYEKVGFYNENDRLMIRDPVEF